MCLGDRQVNRRLQSREHRMDKRAGLVSGLARGIGRASHVRERW
jgi:hypothetical protein